MTHSTPLNSVFFESVNLCSTTPVVFSRALSTSSAAREDGRKPVHTGPEAHGATSH